MHTLDEIPHQEEQERPVFDRCFVVLSPPRASSTAFSRVLWNSPSIRYYVHEPFESNYFQSSGMDSVWKTINDPIDLPHAVGGEKTHEDALLKEITFQVGSEMGMVRRLAGAPIVFLVRDPRLTVSSRINVRRAMGLEEDFPLIESGWMSLVEQVEECREQGTDYLIVDSWNFRSQPERVFAQVAERLEVSFSADWLNWEPTPGMALSNHRTSSSDPFFTRVLSSSRLEAPVEEIPDFDSFSTANGMREHVAWAFDRYQELLRDPRHISP